MVPLSSIAGAFITKLSHIVCGRAIASMGKSLCITVSLVGVARAGTEENTLRVGLQLVSWQHIQLFLSRSSTTQTVILLMRR